MMRIIPDPEVLIEGVRGALLEIERELTPGKNAYGHFIETQDVLPYWTNNISTVRFEPLGEPMYHMYVGASCYCHIARVKEGVKGEKEEYAQLELIRFAAEFASRQLLQSDAYPRGAKGVETVIVQPSALRIVDLGGVALTRAVIINLEIPLLVQIHRR